MHFDNYLNSPKRKLFLEDYHLKAVNLSRVCRSIKLGRAVLVCKGCAEVGYIAQSCKNRFCGTCGASDTYKWSKKMFAKLMNCKHHHVVFTLPTAYRVLSKMNGDKLHNILFKASNEVMRSYFKDEYNLKVGMVSVLHTAGADLKYHPHVHSIVSRGGLDLVKGDYRFPQGDYLCKNEILGRCLKSKFNKLLLNEYDKGELKVYKNITSKADLHKWIGQQKEKHWIVNIEKPLDDIKQIIGYVGRYTKRACLSEYKLEEVSDSKIKFRYNDYKNSLRGEAPSESIRSMNPVEFLDNLLQHVPTKRYRMVRYGGLYNSFYIGKIPQYLKLKVEAEEPIEWDDNYDWGEYEQFRKDVIRAGGPDPFICKNCQLLKEVVLIEFENFSYVPGNKINDSS